MATTGTIGTLQVDLIARTGSFTNDLGAAANSARDSFSRIRASAQDARGGVGAMGDAAEEAALSFGPMRSQIGLLDNAIRGSVSGGLADFTHILSGLAPAFVGMIGPLAAVSGALIIIADLMQKFGKSGDDAGEKSAEFGRKLDEAILQGQLSVVGLKEQIAAVTDGPMGTLVAQAQQLQSLLTAAKFGDEFKKDMEDFAKLPSQQATSAFKQAFTGRDNTGNAASTASGMKDMLQNVNLTEQLRQLNMELFMQKENLQSLENNGASDKEIEQQQQLVTTLEKEQQKLQGVSEALKLKNTLTADTTAAEQAKAEVEAYDNLSSKVTSLIGSTKALTSTTESESQKKIDAINKEENEWLALIPTIQKLDPTLASVVDANIKKLEEQRLEIIANEKSIEQLIAATAKAPDLTQNMTQPVYTGSAKDMTLAKIKENDQFAQDSANKIKQSIESVNQKYQEQVAIITTLHDQGKLTDDEFQKALQAQHDTLTKQTTKDWQEFGKQVGNVVEQAALMGRSWKDALEAILVDVVELIAKMTILNNLKSSGGGVGGFFGSFLSGLFGGGAHADGGTIPPGTIGLTGEDGPELTYGGMTGVTVFPMNRVSTNSQGGNTYYMDFRGASDDIQQKVQMAIQQSENRAVARSWNMVNDLSRRGAH